MKTVFILSGPSGVGKTTIWEEFKKKYPNILVDKVITTTTRKKRDTETHGRDYYFVSVDDFRKLIRNKDLIEYAEVHNNFYGSTFSELENIIKSGKSPIYIVDPQGVKFLKNKLGGLYNIKTIFILPPSIDELKRRLLKRGENLESNNFKVRLNESLIWLEEKDTYDYNIVNDNLENAIEKFKLLILENGNN